MAPHVVNIPRRQTTVASTEKGGTEAAIGISVGVVLAIFAVVVYIYHRRRNAAKARKQKYEQDGSRARARARARGKKAVGAEERRHAQPEAGCRRFPVRNEHSSGASVSHTSSAENSDRSTSTIWPGTSRDAGHRRHHRQRRHHDHHKNDPKTAALPPAARSRHDGTTHWQSATAKWPRNHHHPHHYTAMEDDDSHFFHPEPRASPPSCVAAPRPGPLVSRPTIVTPKVDLHSGLEQTAVLDFVRAATPDAAPSLPAPPQRIHVAADNLRMLKRKPAVRHLAREMVPQLEVVFEFEKGKRTSSSARARATGVAVTTSESKAVVQSLAPSSPAPKIRAKKIRMSDMYLPAKSETDRDAEETIKLI